MQSLCVRCSDSAPDRLSGLSISHTLETNEVRSTVQRKAGTALSSEELDSPGSGLKHHALGSIITSQYASSWDMLLETVKSFPEDEWQKAEIDYFVPARIAYHAIETVDFYLRDDLTAFKWGWRFGVDWDRALPTELPNQRDTLAYLHEIRRQAAEWISEGGDKGMLKTDSRFHAEGISHLDRALYVLRHTHHHIGELCAELRRRNLPRPGWR